MSSHLPGLKAPECKVPLALETFASTAHCSYLLHRPPSSSPKLTKKFSKFLLQTFYISNIVEDTKNAKLRPISSAEETHRGRQNNRLFNT